GDVKKTSDTGIWAQTGEGQLVLIAREGDAAPTASGSLFASFGDPVYNQDDHIAFMAKLKPGSGNATAANAAGIWSNVGGTLALVARQGADAAGVTGGKWSSFMSLGLPDTGGVVFIAKLKGAKPANDVGIWAADVAGNVSLVAREGDQVNVGGTQKTI